MSIQVNEAIMGKLYNDQDTNRYNGSGSVSKDTYLTEGPGSYCLELVEYKTGTSDNEKRFGQSYVVMVFDVIHAEAVRDMDGNTHKPTHKPGDRVTLVKYFHGRVDIKEAFEFTGALLGAPPCTAVPEGPHAGKILPLVAADEVNACAEDDGARVKGTQIWADCVPKKGTGKHAGSTFFNPYAHPTNEDGSKAPFPDWDQLKEAGVDLDAKVLARFGSN